MVKETNSGKDHTFGEAITITYEDDGELQRPGTVGVADFVRVRHIY